LNAATYFLKSAGVTSEPSVIAMFGTAPFWKNFVLCAVAALSLRTSSRTGVSQDMPRNRAAGSVIGQKWQTSSGRRITGSGSREKLAPVGGGL
jgi:hypothetical protein